MPVPLEGIENSTQALENQWKSLVHHIRARTIEIQALDYTEIAHLREIVVGLSNLSEQIQASIGRIADFTAIATSKSEQFLSTRPDDISWLDTLKNNFTLDSVTFRHALRLAILITFSELLSHLLPIPRGYWVTLTVLFALKPNFGGTAQVIGQRVMGTVLGGAVGIGLVMVTQNPLMLAMLLLISLFAAVSLRPLSYSLFIMSLTLGIVLLFEATGIGSWEIGVQRIIDTLIGGAIALAGIYLLFPSWERQQLPAQLQKTLQANLAYFQITMSQYLKDSAPDTDNQLIEQQEDPIFARSLHRLRHQAALQNANAEATAQRLFSDPRHMRGEIEPVMALMHNIRSFYSSTITLTEHLNAASHDHRFSHIEQLSNAIEQALLGLSTAIACQQSLQPLPPLDEYLDTACDRIQQLHRDRLVEMTAHSAKMTPTLQAITTQTPVVTALSQITRTVKGMHSTVARLRDCSNLSL